MAVSEVTKTVYVTSDGQEWATMLAAEAHEERVGLLQWMNKKWGFLMGDVGPYAAELLRDFDVKKKG
jgi:hypothetical protein